jgi:hypothetical protein
MSELSEELKSKRKEVEEASRKVAAAQVVMLRKAGNYSRALAKAGYDEEPTVQRKKRAAPSADATAAAAPAVAVAAEPAKKKTKATKKTKTATEAK